MNNDSKQRVIEYLRSVALQAHEAINALKNDNYGDVRELMGDCQYDLEKAEELLPEEG